jgi:hypothetical protein
MRELLAAVRAGYGDASAYLAHVGVTRAHIERLHELLA